MGKRIVPELVVDNIVLNFGVGDFFCNQAMAVHCEVEGEKVLVRDEFEVLYADGKSRFSDWSQAEQDVRKLIGIKIMISLVWRGPWGEYEQVDHPPNDN